MPTPSRFWREFPQRYRLEAAKCKNCSYIAFPPRLVCPRCQSRTFEAVKLAESGKILTYTVIRVPPHSFADQAPYALGIIELDDGVRLMSQIVDCPFDELKTGKRVKVEFRRIYEEGPAGVIYYGYKFVPA
jgi:uncharacterized OB-fold protein